MSKKMINTASLKKLLESNGVVIAFAQSFEDIDGYMLHIESGDNQLVLSTYLSDKPRMFKRADALIKEARNIGLDSVRFDLAGKALS